MNAIISIDFIFIPIVSTASINNFVSDKVTKEENVKQNEWNSEK